MLVPDAADILGCLFSFSFKIQRWNRHTSSAERVNLPVQPKQETQKR